MSKRSDDSNSDAYIKNSMAEYAKEASSLYEDDNTPRPEHKKGK